MYMHLKRYEDVKADPTASVRKIITFFGLPWFDGRDDVQVKAAMAATRGPTVACIGESQCPLQLGAEGVTRKRTKPWPLLAACPAVPGDGSNEGTGNNNDSMPTDNHKNGHTQEEKKADNEDDDDEHTKQFDSEWESFWASKNTELLH